MNLDFTWERLNVLSTDELLHIRTVAKELINARYAPETKSVLCPNCNGTRVDIGARNNTCSCEVCHGTGRILVTVQHDIDSPVEDVKVMDRYNIVDTITKGKDKYPAGTFWVGYPTGKVKSNGITYNEIDNAKFKDQYPQYRGYTYFKWVSIDEIDLNVYGYIFDIDTNKRVITEIRKQVCDNEDQDIIISYKGKTYLALGKYSSLYGTSMLVTHRVLCARLKDRIHMEQCRNRVRTFTLGYSCIDTGKTIYVGSDECHKCKCYGESTADGKHIICNIHKLDK